MMIEGKSYTVVIIDLYIDDDRDRLVVKGEIHNKIKKENYPFEEYIVLDGHEPNIDVYDN